MWQVNQQRIGAADPVAVVAYSTLKQCTLEKSGGRLKKSRAGGDVVRCHLERGEERESCYVVVRTQLPRSSSPMYLLPWLETTPASRQQYAPGGLQKEKGKGKKRIVRKKERKKKEESKRKRVGENKSL